MSTEPEQAPASPSPQPQAPQPGPPAKSDTRMIAGLLGVLGILYGGWGIHKFVMGYTKEGVIQLLLCLCCGIGTIIGVIEGVIYLTKTDAEFDEIYIKGNKGWF